MAISQETTADELIRLIKEEYINKDNEFQSSRFRLDHPKEYSKLFYHFRSDRKFTSMQKVLNELGCSGKSKALLDMSRDESVGIGKLLFYCDLKSCLEQGYSFSQIAKQLNVSKQYIHRLYKQLEKRFTSKHISK